MKKFRKYFASGLVLIAFVAAAAASASSAVAHPTKRSACSKCHGSSSAVKLVVTQKSSSATKVTYSIKITGGSGTAGWAVLSGGKNIAHKRAKTGKFTVAKGKKIKVWAVKTGSGAKYKSITVK
jgi:hypothetical protein